MEVNTINTQWSDESIIDIVRKFRNNLIKDFLDERYLKDYISHEFGVRDLTPIKIEFIKKDLKELLISPVDLNHYQQVIAHIRMTEDATLSQDDDRLFLKELSALFKRYIYQ